MVDELFESLLPQLGAGVVGGHITGIAYADDIVLYFESHIGMQQLLWVVEKFSVIGV